MLKVKSQLIILIASMLLIVSCTKVGGTPTPLQAENPAAVDGVASPTFVTSTTPVNPENGVASPAIVPSSTPVDPEDGSTVAEIVLHTPDIRTGIDGIDPILDAVLTGDQNTIKALIEFSVLGCTHADRLGGPPKCQDGETEGAPLEVLPFLGHEGHFLRRKEVETWSGIEVRGLYAVYRVSEDAYSTPDYPTGEYAVVFAHVDRISFITLQITGGHIVRVDINIGSPPDDHIEKNSEEIIIPPA